MLGLIQDVKRIGKVAAQEFGQLYTLAFSTRKGVGQTVKRKIAQAHVQQGF